MHLLVGEREGTRLRHQARLVTGGVLRGLCHFRIALPFVRIVELVGVHCDFQVVEGHIMTTGFFNALESHINLSFIEALVDLRVETELFADRQEGSRTYG